MTQRLLLVDWQSHRACGELRPGPRFCHQRLNFERHQHRWCCRSYLLADWRRRIVCLAVLNPPPPHPTPRTLPSANLPTTSKTTRISVYQRQRRPIAHYSDSRRSRLYSLPTNADSKTAHRPLVYYKHIVGSVYHSAVRQIYYRSYQSAHNCTSFVFAKRITILKKL